MKLSTERTLGRRGRFDRRSMLLLLVTITSTLGDARAAGTSPAPPTGIVAAAEDDGDPVPKPANGGKAKSRSAALLADDDLDLEEATTPPTKFFGFDQFEAAYTIPHPAHFSKLINRLEVGAQGAFNADFKWKISGRFDYDAIYDLSNFYPGPVRDDQRFDPMFRETYIDFGAGQFDFRFGRQQIVWGEVVGLFLADVVSAHDLRESIVQDFDLIRIPQWAARVEYFKDDFHLEGVWIPFPSIDRIGKPGSDFFPYPPAPPPGYGYVINDERRPEVSGANRNFGVRASLLKGGWDVAAFAYRSVDESATFFRQVVTGPVPAVVYTPRHEKVTQFGLTASKEFDDYLFRGEAVYTQGRQSNVTRLSDSDGVVRQNYLDYIVGTDLPAPESTRLNVQFFQRVFTDHDPDTFARAVESGVTLFGSTKFAHDVEVQTLLIHSLNRNDWLLRPKLVWAFAKNWRAVAGGDVFGGKPTGLFGQYDRNDRVYLEVRRNF